MSKTPNAHDRYFRAALTYPKVSKELLQQHLPLNVQKIMDWKSLRLCKETYIDDDLTEKMVDVLFAVNLKKNPGYIYLLAEHQSTSDPLMPFRIIEYTVKILRAHLKKYPKEKTLPLVIPLVFYNGEPQYKYSNNIFDLFAKNKTLAEEFMFKNFRLVDISQIPDTELKEHIWAGTLQFFLKHAQDRKVVDKEQAQFFIKKLRWQKGINYIQLTIKYACEVRNIEEKSFFDTMVQETLSLETGEKIMPTIAEYYRQEGVEKGLARGKQEGLVQGIEKGLVQGKQGVAINLLNRGFSIAEVAELTGLAFSEITQLIADRETI